MSNFKLDIFTPNGIVVQDLNCNELHVPTTMGEINILPGHTHVLSEVEPGILLAKVGSGTRSFLMTSGLCKIYGDKITILSTTSEDAEEIDVNRAQAAKSKAESRLAENDKLADLDRIKFERKLERANIRIKLAKAHKN